MIPCTRSPALVKALYIVVALIVLDIVTTLVGVFGMGATELNPIAASLGFGAFVVIKIALSILSVCFIYRYCIPSAPTASKYGIGFLIGFYTIVCALNLFHIAGEIL